MTKFVFEFGYGSDVVVRHFIENDDINEAFDIAKKRTNKSNPVLKFMNAYEAIPIEAKKKPANKTEDGE